MSPNVLSYIGAAYLVLSGLAVFVPKTTRVGRFLSIAVADLKAFLPESKS